MAGSHCVGELSAGHDIFLDNVLIRHDHWSPRTDVSNCHGLIRDFKLTFYGQIDFTRPKCLE